MSESTGVDEFGVTDGYFDISGTWHPTADATRAALHAAIGQPIAGPPLWFVEHGTTPGFQTSCHLTLEDGTELGVENRADDRVAIVPRGGLRREPLPRPPAA